MCSRTRSGKRATSKPRDLRPAAARAQKSAQDSNRGRLARAVGAEEADDLARARFEADGVHRDEIAEPLGQTIGDDPDLADRLSARHPSSSSGEERDEQVLDRRRDALDVVSGDAGALERGLELAGSAIGVVDDDVHAVAHQNRALDAFESADDVARLRAWRVVMATISPGISVFSAAGVSQ